MSMTVEDERIDEVIDTTEMSQREQEEIGLDLWMGEGGMEQMAKLDSLSRAGLLEDDGTTITTTWHGDTLSEAMGGLYQLRDNVRAAGHEAEVEETGTKYILPSTNMYEFKLHINGGDEDE